MKDTHEKIEKIYHQMMMQRSGQERLKMGLSMFDTAKKIIYSTIKDKSRWREEMFLRLYGNDFDEKSKNKILAHIKQYQEKNSLQDDSPAAAIS